ncbi:MAG: family 2A encapsulin nanocompartment cargo protein cysteine desulfurase [Kofleriaceae bacterium]
MYGAPPDLDAFLAINPTSQGLPRVDVNSPISSAERSPASGAMGTSTMPADVGAHGVHANPEGWQGMPTSPTGGHAVPSSVPDEVALPQMPSSGRGPSSPMGSPEIPSAGIVPSSSPFGAPIDLGGLVTHPMHAMTVPTVTEPSTTFALPSGVLPDLSTVAWPHILAGDDARIVRELGRAAFDPYSVRKDFPILDEKVHGGKRLVWLDNAATTQKPRQVIERISYFYEHENSNVHRAAHTLAARSTDAFERARESARRFLNAPSAKEIVWVRGATEGINLIAKTWGRKFVGKGDEIVITHLEHHANIVPWQMLCAEVGAKLRVAPVDDRGDVILEKFERLMGPRTKLVSIPHVSNALGTITPAKQMVEIAHRYGAHVMVDGAQAVSHMKVDVQDLGCEWYVFSGHKVFAPTGIGVVWGKADVLDATPPWQGGGNMIEDVTFEHTKYQAPPWRFEAGTGSIGDAVGLGAAIEYVERIGMDVIDRYEHELLVYGTQRLATVPGLTMIGTSPHKAGVLSFVLDGQRTEDVSAILDKDGIAVRSGHHCAQPILRRYGLEATVRASLAFYNVCEDIDALVESLHELQAGRG